MTNKQPPTTIYLSIGHSNVTSPQIPDLVKKITSKTKIIKLENCQEESQVFKKKQSI